MPRTRPLPAREQEICARLVEFRTAMGLSRADVSRAMGVNQSTLANIEGQRAPLKFSMGYNLCFTYELSLRWLATGKPPKSPFTPIVERILREGGAAKLFSDAYDRVLARVLDAQINKDAKAVNVAEAELGRTVTVKQFLPVGGSPGETLFDLQLTNLRSVAKELDDEGKLNLAKHVGDVLLLYHPLTIKNKDILDTKKAAVSVSGMSSEVPTWSQLRKHITRLTAEHGQKAALADELGVSRQVLGNWLSSDDQGKPDAELTLRLLKWVRDPKRQAK